MLNKQEQIAHLQKLLEIRYKNLSRLEEQKANYGLRVPTDLANELDETRIKIESLKEQLAQVDSVTSSPRQPFEPELILIPAGEFLMGSDPKIDKNARDDELPQHVLYLPNYYIAKTPITNAQYAVFVQSTDHRAPYWDDDRAKSYNWSGKTPPQGKENHPVVLVSWYDAIAYCNWLFEVTGKRYRLPSEAEWEKAARGPDGRIYPWGNEWDAKRCNTHGSKGGTTPVGSYPDGASHYGCLDMIGNVSEWTVSLSEFGYPYNPADGREKQLANNEAFRVLRGGGWFAFDFNVSCASRGGNFPSYMGIGIVRGFRVAV